MGITILWRSLTNGLRAISLGVFLMLAVCPRTNATVRTVTNPTDHIIRGLLSLREAITASVAGDTINFALPAGTVIPLESELVVNLGFSSSDQAQTNSRSGATRRETC